MAAKQRPVKLPPGFELEQSAPSGDVSLPPGFQLEGEGAPLSPQDALQQKIATLKAGNNQMKGAEVRVGGSPGALNSYWDATKYGIGQVVEGGKDFANSFISEQEPGIGTAVMKGAGGPALDMVKSVYGLGKQAMDVPAAIKDIANAPDPVYTVGMSSSRPLAQGAATVLAQAAGMKVNQLAAAEGNAAKVYKRFLEPVKDVPESLPDMTPYQFKGLRREVAKLHPDIAKRMDAGTTTIGDLDQIRMVANKSSQAYFNAKGLPTETSTAFEQVGSSIRDKIYPRMESLHNMKPGSIGAIKRIQGGLIELGDPPKWGHHPVEWAGKAGDRFLRRPAAKGIYNLRTRMADAVMPPPQQIVLRQSMVGGNSVTVKSVQPATIELGGPMAPSGVAPRGGATSILEAMPEYAAPPTANPYAFVDALRKLRK